jgi:putative membrane protein
MLTAMDRERIEAAVGEAEEGTSGDIVCVLAGEVSTYREVPLAWGAAAALLVPPILLAFGLKPLVAAVTGGGWVAASGGAMYDQLALALTAYAVSQVLLFAIVTLIVSVRPVRRALTPKFLKSHRVKKAAFQQFAAAGMQSDAETGILIFIALDDRRVEILSHDAIHAKVGEQVWQAAARAVQEGMTVTDPTAGIIRAVQICGEALKAHFPAQGAAHTLSQKPLEI